MDDLFNFILTLKRISSKIVFNVFNLKFIIKRLFNTFNNHIAVFLYSFISTFKLITRFIINKTFEFIFI